MPYTDIQVERKDGVEWITINRPDRGNMFRRETLLELTAAFEAARRDMAARVCVLTGAGDKFFCIGGEKAEFKGYHYASLLPVMDLYELIDRIPIPVIAAVNGFAVGGGHVLHVMCDFTVASDRAVFRQVGPAMGSFDAGYGTWQLEDLVGKKRAKEIWMLNRKYTAAEALQMGLVNEVVPHDRLRARVEEWCADLKKRGPQALAAIKLAFFARHNGVQGLSRVAHDLLNPYYYRTDESKELAEAFQAKRDPDPKKFHR